MLMNNENNENKQNIEQETVRRLGFNPTSKGRKSKIELKKTA